MCGHALMLTYQTSIHSNAYSRNIKKKEHTDTDTCVHREDHTLAENECYIILCE